PAAAAISGDDDAVDGLGHLELEPPLAAAAGRVRAPQVLGDHSFVAGRQGPVEEGLGDGRGLDDLPLGEVATRRHPHERLPALRIGRVDERAALYEQAVEEVDCDRYPGDR